MNQNQNYYIGQNFGSSSTKIPNEYKEETSKNIQLQTIRSSLNKKKPIFQHNTNIKNNKVILIITSSDDDLNGLQKRYQNEY